MTNFMKNTRDAMQRQGIHGGRLTLGRPSAPVVSADPVPTTSKTIVEVAAAPPAPERDVEKPIVTLDMLYTIKQAIAGHEERAEQGVQGHHQAIMDVAVDILGFHAACVVKTKKNRNDEIIGFEYQPKIQKELDVRYGKKKPKPGTNPILPLTKLTLEEVPCKNAATRYVRDGKYAECAFYAAKHGFGPAEFRADLEKEGGRDKYALMAARARKGNTGAAVAGGDSATCVTSAETLGTLLASQVPAGTIPSSVESPVWAWLKQDADGHAAVIPLPGACTEEITQAIIRILNKQEKNV